MVEGKGEMGVCHLQGPAVIAEKLGYFIQTGQATQLMQQAGFRIGNIELSSFFPLPGVPSPAPGPLGNGLAGAQGAASIQPSSQAGEYLNIALGLSLRVPALPTLC